MTFFCGFMLVLVTALCAPGFAFPKQSNFFGSFPLYAGRTLQDPRQTRDANDGDPCTNYLSCALPNNRLLHTMEVMRSYRFDLVPGIFAEACAPVTIPEPSDCNCHQQFLIYIAGRLNRLWEWSCQHTEEFEAGAACWTDSFREGMYRCHESINADMYPHEFINCAETSTRAIPNSNCTADDVQFLHSVLAHSLLSVSD